MDSNYPPSYCRTCGMEMSDQLTCSGRCLGWRKQWRELARRLNVPGHQEMNWQSLHTASMSFILSELSNGK